MTSDRAKDILQRLPNGTISESVISELPLSLRDNESFVFLSYPLDNKYYRASLDFYLTDSVVFSDSSDTTSDNEPHTIPSFDATTLSALTRLAHSANRFNPAIRLCIAYTERDDSSLTRNDNDVPVASLVEETLADMLDWCLEHEYELVHTHPDEDVDDTEDGVGRIREALEAHIWPHCEMKTTRSASTVALDEMETALALNTTDEAKDATNDKQQLVSSKSSSLPFRHSATTSRTSIRYLIWNPFLSALTSNQLKDLDQMDGEFDRLLQMMLHAREMATQLPDTERHALAEQVITTLAHLTVETDQPQTDSPLQSMTPPVNDSHITNVVSNTVDPCIDDISSK
ncbi:hypothetical protein BDF22DRAFT_672463 [Syncephalis plumigaleata]|nr:hypothetical protein BDF22DRAFT_672463 [Syncephalis plumigaleata]